MRSMQPTVASKAGEVRIVDSRNFPVSKKVAAGLLIIKPGHMREIHWHPNAAEWQYWISGKGRMTVFFPVDNARTMDYNTNDVGFVPPTHLTISKTQVIPTWWSWSCSQLTSSWMFP